MTSSKAALPTFQLPLPAAQFMQQYWQKKPLLMPASATGLQHPDANALAGLTLEDCVESQLISGAGNGPWNNQSGPFTEQDFATLPKQNWTLLVQSVDHFMTEVSLLLDGFSFLPSWRAEDIMLSYAVKGGSIGPHTDRYDTFLLQASGTRRWQIGSPSAQSSPQADESAATEELIATPGDVIYLPPGASYWGIAEEDDCITWSVRFRAPAPVDLLARLADEAIERGADQTRYVDPQRGPCQQPELLNNSDLDSLCEQAVKLIDRSVMRDALSALLSEAHQPAGLDFDVDCDHIAAASPAIAMVRHGAVRLLIDSQGDAWINGEKCSLNDQQRPLAALLARQRSYTEIELQPLLNDDSEVLMEEWIDAGYFNTIE